jgi:hypothetical protein
VQLRPAHVRARRGWQGQRIQQEVARHRSRICVQRRGLSHRLPGLPRDPRNRAGLAANPRALRATISAPTRGARGTELGVPTFRAGGGEITKRIRALRDGSAQQRAAGVRALHPK